MRNEVAQFREAMQSAGLTPPEFIENGVLHRFPGADKRSGNTAGWCKLFADGIGGVFGDHSRDLSDHWQAQRPIPLTPDQREAFHRRVQESKALADAERAAQQIDAAKRACEIWEAAPPATDDHPYLKAKGIRANGARLSKGALVLPVREGATLHSLQFIDAQSTKRFLSFGRVRGCYFAIGNPRGAAAVCIVEGFATGATIHELTGYPVAVAFNAGNLEAVALYMRTKFPDVQIVVCADDDSGTTGNPGISKATAAALAAGGTLAIPTFGDDRPENATDFNDVAAHAGLDAVRRVIEAAIVPAMPIRQPDAENAVAADVERLRPVIQPMAALCVRELARHTFKPRSALLSPWLNTQEVSMVFAGRGIGKTHFSIAVGYAVATGGTFAGWQAPAPAKVLYLDGELPGIVMQKRLLQHLPDVEPAPGFLRVFTPDLLPDGQPMPDVSTQAGQMVIDRLIEPDTALVILDNLSAWARTGIENDAASWVDVSQWLLSLRRRGISVLLVHHAGKGGAQRGTSKREDLLDCSIELRRPSDYQPEQGAVFELAFTKARHLTGDDAQSLEFTLTGDEDKAVWLHRTVEHSTFDRVVTLAQDGLNPGEIATELGINKSSVSRHLRKAKSIGSLPATSK